VSLQSWWPWEPVVVVYPRVKHPQLVAATHLLQKPQQVLVTLLAWKSQQLAVNPAEQPYRLQNFDLDRLGYRTMGKKHRFH
jgi:hypothetical protein